MKLTVTGKIGDDGFSERLTARYLARTGWRACELFWIPEAADSNNQDLPLRVRDVGSFFKRFRDPLFPRTLAWGAVADGVGIVREPLIALPFSRWEGCQVEERVVLEMMAQVATALHAIHHRPDPETGEPTGFVHRSLRAPALHLTGSARILCTGLDAMRAHWRGRLVATTDDARGCRPGLREAPEQYDNFDAHPTDIYLLALVAFQLLTTQEHLATCRRQPVPRDLDGFESTWERRIGGLPAKVSDPTRRLLQEALAYRWRERPDGAELTRRAREAGASGPALLEFARDHVAEVEPPILPHELCGNEWELEDMPEAGAGTAEAPAFPFGRSPPAAPDPVEPKAPAPPPVEARPTEPPRVILRSRPTPHEAPVAPDEPVSPPSVPPTPADPMPAEPAPTPLPAPQSMTWVWLGFACLVLAASATWAILIASVLGGGP